MDFPDGMHGNKLHSPCSVNLTFCGLGTHIKATYCVQIHQANCAQSRQTDSTYTENLMFPRSIRPAQTYKPAQLHTHCMAQALCVHELLRSVQTAAQQHTHTSNHTHASLQPASSSHVQIPSSLLRVLTCQGITEITTSKMSTILR